MWSGGHLWYQERAYVDESDIDILKRGEMKDSLNHALPLLQRQGKGKCPSAPLFYSCQTLLQY